MKISVSDRISFIIFALRKHLFIIGICSLFLIVGIGLMYIAYISSETLLYYFGGFFSVFALFFMSLTLPSSVMYYYEQAETKKYGVYTDGIITGKKIIDHTYYDKKRKEKIEEFFYELSFMFEYQQINYENAFIVSTRKCYDAVNIKDSIRVKYLRTKPKKSVVVERSFSKKYGFKIEQCF